MARHQLDLTEKQLDELVDVVERALKLDMAINDLDEDDLSPWAPNTDDLFANVLRDRIAAELLLQLLERARFESRRKVA